MRCTFNRVPAPPAFGKGKLLPEEHVSIFSRLVFQWLMPFLNVGYSRPLEYDDFWEFPKHLQTSTLADKLEKNFFARCAPEQRPHFLRSADSQPSSEKSSGIAAEEPDLESAPQKKAQKYDSSLQLALNKTFFRRWWTAGALKFCADTLRATSPIVTKLFLSWLTRTYKYHHATDAQRAEKHLTQPQGLGYGIGLAFALFAMQEAASLMMNHYFHGAMATGMLSRTAVTGVIIRKSLRLSRRARLDHNTGQITTLISTDASRVDWFAYVGHGLWTGPIQITIGTALLISNLGVSALVGLGVLVVGFPLQIVLVRVMFMQRKSCAKITDARLQLTTEVLQGIRLIKYYAWEQFYMAKVVALRSKEIHAIKAMAIARSALIALVTFIPVAATIMSFIAYALLGHELTVPVVFASLQLFNVIRAPLGFLPTTFSSLSDFLVATSRIKKFLLSPEISDSIVIDESAVNGVDAEGNFVWEGFGKDNGADEKSNETEKHKQTSSKHTRGKSTIESASISDEKMASEEHEPPFQLNNLMFRVPKGSFVAVVGRVGSGKSSLLQALINEMPKTSGTIVFGGRVAYVPQSPWIRNATIRENIVFGNEDDEQRFRHVIRACSLEHDLEMLPNGEETEIGEKGINLSGGQQARVSLARAAYSTAEVVLLDDTLSALDAYVGQAVLDKCILSGPLAGRTRILATHALNVLEKTDYIYVMDHGAIIEQGTYSELMKSSTVFAHLIEDYGSHEQAAEQLARRKTRKGNLQPEQKKHTEKVKLIQDEERVTGAVAWVTYTEYFGFAGGNFWVPVIILLVLLSQAAALGNNIFLGYWTSSGVPGFSPANYMAVYGAFGLAQSIFSFLLSYGLAYAGLTAGLAMFNSCFSAVLHSPESFFDTTPLGRILARLSKDQDILDSNLTPVMSQFLYSFGSVLAVAALVLYTFPPLGSIFIPLGIIYYVISVYYRHSAVETQRLDSLMRSSLFSTFTETLTGLSTIRAYGEQNRTRVNIENHLDLENRATYMTVSIQQWLAARLDLSGNVLILGICLFGAGLRNSVDPSKVGVVLAFTLSITQLFSDMVSQYAKNEQNMNSVERVLTYTELPSEGDIVTQNDPPPSWPEKGGVRFSHVDLAYREGLPFVLRDISFEVRPGEKIGIVGRTGAGKSSLLQALFRMVKLSGGEIIIDGHNISDMGLRALRSSLALVPQDSTLFRGNLRDNLDPQSTRTDAELISALQRTYLLPTSEASDSVAEAKFGLDAVVGDEGSNYSAGEKQLLALCRALIKNSRIIVLDEATSSVDVETDLKVQRTIQTEFASSTLLCIAHRLNTVASYDRILVMDKGRVAEFNTVLGLFDQPSSIFRSLCNEAGLSREDISRIRDERAFTGRKEAEA